MITIVGLGPAVAGGMSMAARDALRAAKWLYLRTRIHPAATELAADGIRFETFDTFYESSQSFEQVYAKIVDRIMEMSERYEITYAVPGHPLVAEESVRLLLIGAKRSGIETRIIGSSSFIEPTLSALGWSITDGLVMLDALTLQPRQLNPDQAQLIYQVYDQSTASAVKLQLMQRYPDDWVCKLVTSAGDPDLERVEEVELHRLDRLPVNHLSSLFVPPLPRELQRGRLDDLVEVMARLRAPDGCPWDLEQDHKTLKKYMIEETYEAIEAIDANDPDALCEELGDVLLQVVFHAQLETELGVFDIQDVIRKIVDKLIRRHPHVFGDLSVEDSAEVLRNWEQIKKSEKAEGWRESALDGVPVGLPALMRALEISKRAVKVGFEWEKFEDVLAKLDEEVAELRGAIATADAREVKSEVGDLLFTIVNVARWQKIDPEVALREMVDRFGRRFRFIEKRAKETGRAVSELSLAEMDKFWDEAKRSE
ncbi:MAG: nucleoside triphosphate pyrophosphohydrolase [Chthonomonadales bacterium]